MDSNEPSLECSKLNLELFGTYHNIDYKNVDIIDLWFPITGTPDNLFRPKQVNFYNKLAVDLNMHDPQVDLILCNPPWIPANTMNEFDPLENAVYDPKERFLWSCLNFAKYHLSPDGEMLLIYSDLATNLGLQEPQRIQNLS